MNKKKKIHLEKNSIACSVLPANAILPSAIKIIFWNKSKIAELGWWIVQRTVLPLPAIDVNCDIRKLAECASRPVVGSSKNKIFGSVKSYKKKINIKYILN